MTHTLTHASVRRSFRGIVFLLVQVLNTGKRRASLGAAEKNDRAEKRANVGKYRLAARSLVSAHNKLKAVARQCKGKQEAYTSTACALDQLNQNVRVLLEEKKHLQQCLMRNHRDLQIQKQSVAQASEQARQVAATIKPPGPAEQVLVAEAVQQACGAKAEHVCLCVFVRGAGALAERESTSGIFGWAW
jgi:hypothetical protein